MSDLDDLAEIAERSGFRARPSIRSTQQQRYWLGRRRKVAKATGGHPRAGKGDRRRRMPSLPKLKCLEGDDA